MDAKQTPLVDLLRLHADDLHSDYGHNRSSRLLSQAADEIDRLKLNLVALEDEKNTYIDYVGDALGQDHDDETLWDAAQRVLSERGRLRAELAEAQRDADRYRRLCSLVAWGELGVCRGHNDTDEFADDGDMLDAWLDSPEMIAEAQGIDAAIAAKGE